MFLEKSGPGRKDQCRLCSTNIPMLLTLAVGMGSEISSDFANMTLAFPQSMFSEQETSHEQNASLFT